MAFKLTYDADRTSSSALVQCPICQVPMYFPGYHNPDACHTDDCPDRAKGKSNLVMIIGPKYVAEVIERAKHVGDDASTMDNVSLNRLRNELPEALP